MTTTVENYKKTYGLVMDSPDQISSMRQIDEIANDIFVSGLPEPEETSHLLDLIWLDFGFGNSTIIFYFTFQIMYYFLI